MHSKIFWGGIDAPFYCCFNSLFQFEAAPWSLESNWWLSINTSIFSFVVSILLVSMKQEEKHGQIQCPLKSMGAFACTLMGYGSDSICIDRRPVFSLRRHGDSPKEREFKRTFRQRTIKIVGTQILNTSGRVCVVLCLYVLTAYILTTIFSFSFTEIVLVPHNLSHFFKHKNVQIQFY